MTPDPRPVMEGTGYRASVAGRTMLCVQWSTETASGGLDDVRLRVIPWAKEEKCAALLHCDAVAHEPLLEQAVALVEAAGVVAIRGAHAVEDAAAFESQLRHFASLGPKVGVTRNFRWQLKDPAKFRECMHTVDRLRREFGSRIVVDWFLGWQHATPEMRAYAEAVMRLTPTPAHLPGYVPPPVVVVPPVVTPEPPPYRPGRGGGKQEEKPSFFSRKQ